MILPKRNNAIIASAFWAFWFQ